MEEKDLSKLIGQKFDKLTIIDYHKKENSNQIICTVQCDCGSEPRDVPLYLLTNGNNKSCGCTQGKGKSKKPIVGERFNRLLVLAENEETGVVKVKCDCGNEYEIPKFRSKMAALKRNGMCKECKSKEKNKKYTDIEPKSKFNYWTVIKRVKDDKSGQAQYECKCQCGNKKVVLGKNLVRGLSKSCGCIKSMNFNGVKKLNGLTATKLGRRLYNMWSSNQYYVKKYNRENKFFPDWAELEDGFLKFYEWATKKDEPYDSINRPYIARYDETKDYTPENCYFTKNRSRVIHSKSIVKTNTNI